MNAKELLKMKLQEIGADGLVNTTMDCGCGVENLAPDDSCDCYDLLDCLVAWKGKDGRYHPFED